MKTLAFQIHFNDNGTVTLQLDGETHNMPSDPHIADKITRIIRHRLQTTEKDLHTWAKSLGVTLPRIGEKKDDEER